jgi:hypothetical protein
MILGMSASTFTLAHVVLSLIGIFSGIIVLFGMFSAKRLAGWTQLFLATTVLTSVTGFFFPFDQFLPSHKVGILSLIVLAVAIFAHYARHLAGAWRSTYVITAAIALYLNVFVLIAQLFQKVPALSDGADPIRAAIPSHAARCSGALRRAWHRRGKIVSPWYQSARVKPRMNSFTRLPLLDSP